MEVKKINEVVKYNLTVTEEELKHIYKTIQCEVEGAKSCDNTTYEMYKKLKNIVEAPVAYSQCGLEINRLADFIQNEMPGEIGKGTSESAVDVAIRLLKNKKHGCNISE